MDKLNLEDLLHEEESSYLDFKQQQYPFVGENDYVKSELLKDILAFANAWRRQEAIILIGVEEVKGGRGIVNGVADHLEDANLQQFVNSKINEPLSFLYEAHSIDGEPVGVIRIPVQKRPFFAVKTYGKVSENAVYLRRNSSTDKATPMEVFRMGESWQEENVEKPVLNLQFGDKGLDQTLGCSHLITSTVIQLPDVKDIPTLREEKPLIGVQSEQPNSNYYRDVASYLREHAMLAPLSFHVRNTSTVLARNVEMRVSWEAPREFAIQTDYPKKPKKKTNTFYDIPSILDTDQPQQIKRKGGFWRQSIDFGNIRPKEAVWSPTFYTGCSINEIAEALVTIYADNLSAPIKETCKIEFEIEPHEINVEKLLSIADKQG